MTAQRPVKNGLVPGMPSMHHVRMKRSNFSILSFLATRLVGSARAWGIKEPPGVVALR